MATASSTTLRARPHFGYTSVDEDRLPIQDDVLDDADKHVVAFYTDDDGHCSLYDLASPITLEGSSRNLSGLKRFSSTSMVSLQSTRSSSSSNTVIRNDGAIRVSMLELCDLVDKYRSLQEARVVSCTTYVQNRRFAPHRHIVLLLRRPGRKDIYVRIDRRPTSAKALIRGAGVTPANDEALLSATLSYIIDESQYKIEAEQVFSADGAIMSALSDFLRIIWRVLTEYTVYSKNCWMLCSFLHEHLGEVGAGVFVVGRLQHEIFAAEAKSRVRDEVQRSCRVLLSDAFVKLLKTIRGRGNLSAEVDKQISEALSLAKQEGVSASGNPDQKLVIRHISDATQLVNRLWRVHSWLIETNHQNEACVLSGECVEITRQLHRRAPNTYNRTLAPLLVGHADCLSRAGMHAEACEFWSDAVAVKRRLRILEHGRHELSLAFYLDAYAESLLSVKSFKEASEVLSEVVRLSHDLSVLDRGNREIDLTERLALYGFCLYKIGRFTEARDIMAEAIKLLDDFAPHTRRGLNIHFATYIAIYALALLCSGKYEEAKAESDESFKLALRLSDGPDSSRVTSLSFLRECREEYRDCLFTLGHEAEAKIFEDETRLLWNFWSQKGLITSSERKSPTAEYKGDIVQTWY